jgi:hypothetical protein
MRDRVGGIDEHDLPEGWSHAGVPFALQAM